MPRNPTAGDWAALMALTIMWGLSFAFTEMALESFPPAAIVVSRTAVALLVLVLALKARGASLAGRSARWWLQIAAMAALGTLLPFHLIAWGQQHIDSATAGVLMAVMPLFVLALAHRFVPGARITVVKALGFLAGFLGVALVIGADSIRLARDNLELWGMIAVLAAAFSYAANAVYARKVDPEDPVATSAGMMLLTAALSLPAAAFDTSSVHLPVTGPAVVAILFLGLVSTGIASVLYFRIIQGPGPTFLSLINYLIPALAVVAGAVLLGESLSIRTLVGLGLILAGVGIGELRGLTARLRTRSPAVAVPADDAG